MKYSWKDKCKCGHSRNLHTWDYANNVTHVDQCKDCSCQMFALDEVTAP